MCITQQSSGLAAKAHGIHRAVLLASLLARAQPGRVSELRLEGLGPWQQTSQESGRIGIEGA